MLNQLFHIDEAADQAGDRWKRAFCCTQETALSQMSQDMRIHMVAKCLGINGTIYLALTCNVSNSTYLFSELSFIFSTQLEEKMIIVTRSENYTRKIFKFYIEPIDKCRSELYTILTHINLSINAISVIYRYQ